MNIALSLSRCLLTLTFCFNFNLLSGQRQQQQRVAYLISNGNKSPVKNAYGKSACSELRVRKELRTLTTVEWREIVDVLTRMYHMGVFDRFAWRHTHYFPPIHDHAQFLPWHRQFVFEFETIMRLINPGVTLPYWVSFLFPPLEKRGK